MEGMLNTISNSTKDFTLFKPVEYLFNESYPYIKQPLNENGYYQSWTGYNYSFIFKFEEKYFNSEYNRASMDRMSKYFTQMFIYALVYLAVIFSAQSLMKRGEKFELRRALIAWNFVLAGFSAFGAIRVWPEFIHVIKTKGIEHSYCSPDWQYGVTGGWGGLFILSKFPELVDTCFIVARKQKLIFLHWYHHCSVLMYAWFSCTDFAASGRWCVVMNFTVHAFMYTYYGFRALHFKIPKWVNILITSMQIIQMVFGVYINVSSYFIKRNGGYCFNSDENLNFAFLMYFSYLILFSNFFYQSYISPSKRAVKATTTQDETNGDCDISKVIEIEKQINVSTVDSAVNATRSSRIRKYIMWTFKEKKN